MHEDMVSHSRHYFRVLSRHFFISQKWRANQNHVVHHFKSWLNCACHLPLPFHRAEADENVQGMCLGTTLLVVFLLLMRMEMKPLLPWKRHTYARHLRDDVIDH